MLLTRAAELHDWTLADKAEGTRRLYGIVHHQFTAYMQGIGTAEPHFSDLTPLHVLGFQRWLMTRPLHEGKHVSPMTLFSYTSILKAWSSSVTKLLADERHPRTDLLHGLVLPKVPKRIPRALQLEQFDRLVAACQMTEYPHRNTAILRLFGDTGVRVSELCGMQLEGLDFRKHEAALRSDAPRGTVTVIQKGDKEAMLAFGMDSRRALESYLKNERPKKSPYTTLFLARGGNPINPALVRVLLHELQRLAGLDDIRIHPHLLRSSFATWQSEANVDINTIRQQLGHTQLSTTMRYVAPRQDLLATYSSPLSRRRGGDNPNKRGNGRYS